MNKLILNVKKTKLIPIGSVRKEQTLPCLQLMTNGTMIEQVDEIRLLGVQLNSHLSWTPHISNLCKKLVQTAVMVGRIAKYLPTKILRQVSHALIVSQVNYCAAVWGNAGAGETRRLQAAQNKAARIILRCPNDSPIEKRYKKLEWLYIRDIIARNVLKLFYNLHVKKKPKHLICSISGFKDFILD